MPLYIAKKSKLFRNGVYVWEFPLRAIFPFTSLAAVLIGSLVVGILKPLHLDPIGWLNRPWDPKAKMASLAEDKGNKAYSIGKYREAINAYNQVLTLKPDSNPVHFNRGTAYFLLGQKQKAREDYLWVYHYSHAHPDPMGDKLAHMDGYKNADERFEKVHLSKVGGL